MNAATIDAVSLKRLRWRCRRGMRELDRLFERQLDRILASGSAAELAQLERLLECEDDQLWRWSLGHERPSDPSLANLIDAIRARDPD